MATDVALALLNRLETSEAALAAINDQMERRAALLHNIGANGSLAEVVGTILARLEELEHWRGGALPIVQRAMEISVGHHKSCKCTLCKARRGRS